jgi:lipoprotein-anchoring transpeptidase ErfK/SrfK
MRILRLISVVMALLVLPVAAAQAAVVAKIDLSSQTMNVYVNGSLTHSWAVSTARKGYVTPRGSFRPYLLKRMHYSSKYNNSPMPHSIFFRGGYAIHGTGYVKQLGRPASHGCVRLHPANAAALYALVQRYGASNTRIVIGN